MTWRRLLLTTLTALLLAGCASAATPAPTAAPTVPPLDLRGAVFNPPRELADFTLASTSGQPFRLSEHRGEIILMYFGYRTCPDFCPTTFNELKRVYEALGEPAERVKVVFVTVDPERDTLDYLALYTHAFHQDFIGLRDDGPALQALMDAFGVVAERRPLADSPLAYLIDHTASVFLIGPDGRLRVQFLYGTDYRDIIHDVQALLEQM